MKKCLVFILVILLTVSSVSFADGFDVGLTSGLDYYAKNTAGTASEFCFGGGLHLGWSTYFGQSIFGIGAFGNLALYTGNDKKVTGTLLIGPVLDIVEIDSFSLPIAVGFLGGAHTLMPVNFSDLKLRIGAGLSVTPQIMLSDTIHFFTRVQAGFNFYPDFVASITVSPGIGFTPRIKYQPHPGGNYLPPSPASGFQSSPSNYYIAINRQNFGPYDWEQLQLMVQLGILTRDTLVWKEGMAQWVAAGVIPELAMLFRKTPHTLR